MGLNPEFWRGRRVLVTGHTGFKGGWLCVWLRRFGAQVSGIALDPPTDPSLFEIAEVERGIDSSRIDINDFASTRREIERVEPEIVFHLAAQPLVRLSYEQPVTTISTNVLGTTHVLESVRGLESACAMVVVTSDKCYENRESSKPYGEAERMGGRDPYSCSKGCAELVSAAYRSSFLDSMDIHLATARSGNVFGGGDWSRDRLVPDFFRCVMVDEDVCIRNPAAIRPWQHVLDPLCGYLMLAEKLVSTGREFAEAWNFGPDPRVVTSVADMVQILADEWGEGARWVHRGDVNGPHEAMSLMLDSSKAQEKLGWSSVWNIREGLRRTVEWYRAFAAGGDMRKVMESQIADYMVRLDGYPDANPLTRSSGVQGQIQ